MDRRTFLAGTGAVVLAAPFAAEAQQAGRMYRIGWLTPAVGLGEKLSRLFEKAMRALGYVEGQTLAFESRSAGDDLDQLPRLARELVSSKVDVIVAVKSARNPCGEASDGHYPIVMAFWWGRVVWSSLE